MMRAIAAIVSCVLIVGSCTAIHLMVRSHWASIIAAFRGEL